MIAGVLTAAELALLRTRPQRNHIHLAIPEYNTVYTAKVDGTPPINDMLAVLPFKAPTTGVLTDVDFGMTMMVGSVAGADDIGLARIRRDAVGGDVHFHIGASSEIDFADNQFLTITDEFTIWPRHPYVDPTTYVTYMDFGETYTNEHEYFNPVVIMGPHRVCEPGDTLNFDASNSYVVGDIAPAHYHYTWTCTNGALVVVPATPNAVSTDITFPSSGTFLVTLSLEADYGGAPLDKTSIGHRYVVVYDNTHPLIDDPVLEECEGDYSAGGWAYRVTLYNHADTTWIADRVLCMLVADDWYGDTQQSIGPITGAENIVCIGWINGDTIEWSNDRGSVTFEVAGPQFWMDKIFSFPTGVDDALVAPTAWTQIENLTVRKGIFSFLHWRTTLPMITDIVSMTTDTRRLATTYTPNGSIWEQLSAIAGRIKANVLCDRYSRIYCEIDPQMEDALTRATFPIVQSFNDPADPTTVGRDWRDAISIERRMTPETSLIDLSGVYWTGTAATSLPFFSLSPGHIYKRLGRPEKIERIALSGQSQANDMAGKMLGWMNNEYPVIDIPLSSNHRAFDICPPMYANLYMQTTDTPRGIEFDPKKIIPRRISFSRDERTAVLFTDVTFEAETFAVDAIIGDPPITPPDPPDPPDPPPPVEPPTPEAIDIVAVMTYNQLKYTTEFFTAANPHWVDLVTGLLAGPAIGTFLNFALSSNLTAYVITYGADRDANGLFRCADVTVSPAVWVLDQSQNDLIAMMEAITGVHDIIYLVGLAVDSSGKAYATFDTSLALAIGYITDTAGVMAFNFTGVMGHSTIQIAMEFSVWSNGTDVRIGYGYPGISDTALVYDPIAACHTAHTADGERSALSPIAGHTLIGNAGKLISYTNCTDLSQDPPLFDDAAYRYPIEYKDAHIFYISNVTGNLMIDGAVQAIPNDSGGTSGVFSTGGAGGAGFMCVNGYGEIIWVASSDHTINSKGSIAFTNNGGVTWSIKDGDWVDFSGWYLLTQTYPFVRWISYVP